VAVLDAQAKAWAYPRSNGENKAASMNRLTAITWAYPRSNGENKGKIRFLRCIAE